MREYFCEKPSKICKQMTNAQCKKCYEVSKKCSHKRKGTENLATSVQQTFCEEINKIILEKEDA